MMYDHQINPQTIVKPNSFIGLMTLYESNYLRLLNLIPNIKDLEGFYIGNTADENDILFIVNEKTIQMIKLNVYMKAFIGGVFLIGLSFIFGDEYFGLGIDTVSDSFFSDKNISADIPWYAFILKTVFTSVTLGAGGSGGVLTPIFFVGATSGNFFGSIVGEHLAFFSAIGFVSVLAGAANAPIAAIIMAVELFGLEIAPYAAVSIVISFLITGHRSIFPSQILKMSKSEMLDINMGEDIDHTLVSMRKKDKQRLNILKLKIKARRKRKNKKNREHDQS